MQGGTKYIILKFNYLFGIFHRPSRSVAVSTSALRVELGSTADMARTRASAIAGMIRRITMRVAIAPEHAPEHASKSR